MNTSPITPQPTLSPSTILNSPTSPPQFIYAVPISLDSFIRGITVHQHWAPRFWEPRKKAFRESIYKIQDRDTPNRKIVKRLPGEVLAIIEQYVREDGFQKVRRSWEGRSRKLKEAQDRVCVSLELLEREGSAGVAVEENRVGDPIKEYMMKTFSLVIMPGMSTYWNNDKRLTHIFLCAFDNINSLQQANEERYDPSQYPHPALGNKNLHGRKKTIWTISKPKLPKTVETMDPEFVNEALDGKSKIGMAVREMDLEVLAADGL